MRPLWALAAVAAADLLERQLRSRPIQPDIVVEHLALSAGGNHPSVPHITISATGDLINPAISDGLWTIVYNGTVPAASVLVFDGPNSRAILDGVDVTPYTTGLFPHIEPEGTTLTYTDDPASSHDAEAVVSFHDRWW